LNSRSEYSAKDFGAKEAARRKLGRVAQFSGFVFGLGVGG
jgi:hypothetical protein